MNPFEEGPLMSKLSEQMILSAIVRPERVSPTRVEFPGVEMTVRFVNATLLDKDNKPDLYYQVQANMTISGKVQQWRSEGYDLDQAIRETVGKIPVALLGLGTSSNKSKSRRRVVKRSTATPAATKRKKTIEPERSQSKRVVVRRKG